MNRSILFLSLGLMATLVQPLQASQQASQAQCAMHTKAEIINELTQLSWMITLHYLTDAQLSIENHLYKTEGTLRAGISRAGAEIRDHLARLIQKDPTIKYLDLISNALNALDTPALESLFRRFITLGERCPCVVFVDSRKIDSTIVVEGALIIFMSAEVVERCKELAKLTF